MFIVTGGAGFIGSNLVAALERSGAKVGVCDVFGADDKWLNLRKRALDVIIKPEELISFLDSTQDRVEAIIHLGAISETTERDVDLIIQRNVRFTMDLWLKCRERGIRMIYASSAATYGNGANGFNDAEDADSLSRLQPLNPYGWSKHVVDRWIARRGGWKNPDGPPQCAGLKFFNVYGPNEYHKGGQRSVVHQIFPVARRGEAFPLFKSDNPMYGDGGQLRDFIWVGDCVDVMLWLLSNPGVSGLFNCGTGKARSFSDLATAVYKSLGSDAKIAFRDMPEVLRGKYQYFTEAAMGKLRGAGYSKPFTSLEDGVGKYVSQYLAQEDNYV